MPDAKISDVAKQISSIVAGLRSADVESATKGSAPSNPLRWHPNAPDENSFLTPFAALKTAVPNNWQSDAGRQPAIELIQALQLKRRG